MKRENRKVIVFADEILQYKIGNSAQKQAVCKACRKGKGGVQDEKMFDDFGRL